MQRCQAREVAPVCYLKKTAASKPRLVALLPASSVDNDFSPAKLNGFHVFYLPFMNDIRGTHEDSKQLCHSEIRPNGEEKLVRAGEEEKLAAMAIIKKLRGSYIPDNFENRSLRSAWKQIETKALNRSTEAEVDDPTEPNIPQMTKRIGVPASQFNRLVFPEGYLDQLAGEAQEALRAQERRNMIASAPVDVSEVEEAASQNRVRGAYIFNCLRFDNYYFLTLYFS